MGQSIMNTTNGNNPDDTENKEFLTTNDEIDSYLGVDADELKKADTLSPSNEPTIIIVTKGKEIVKQGDPSHHAYYIKSGRAEVIVEEDGHSLVLAEIGPGEVFGEIGVLESESRSASVRAIEKCEVVPLSKKDMQARIDNVGDHVVRSLIDVLIKRLRASSTNQFTHYKKLVDFQDKMTGIIKLAEAGVAHDKRKAFTKEVMPLLDQLEQLLKKYRD